MNVEIELLIYNITTNQYLQPIVENITWTTTRAGSPGQLEFKIPKTKGLKLGEGDHIRLKVNGQNIFYGFIFKRKRDKDQIVTVTAYDQLRYLKNKNTYSYKKKTLTQVIKMIAKDFELKTGDLVDTKYKIPSRVEDNSTLFDIIQNAMDLTMQHKSKMYVMYDDFGKIVLKNLSNMKVKVGNQYLMITNETAENFDYSSSIDDNTYNQIKVVYKNDETSKSEVYMAKASETIGRWGVLQKYETAQKGEGAQSKANALLNLYNSPTRTLQIKNVKGCLGVRAGSLVMVYLNLGDRTISNWMLVEKCKHEFEESQHFMTLNLRGGAINA